MSELPAGFVLDGQRDPALPDGFTIDQPAAAKKPFGWGDTWPARMAKSLYSAATLPGDVAQGKVSMVGEDGHTNPEVIGRAAELASVATPMSPAARVGVGFAGVPTTTSATPSREALLAAASQGYDKARGLGVEVAPRAVSDLGTRIGSELTEKGVNGELAPKTFSILSKLDAPPADSVATLANLETLRRSFGHAAKDFANPTEQLAARSAQSRLDDYLAAIPAEDVIRGPAAEASKILSDARGNYGAAKRSQQIAEALETADLQAAAANSGQNIGNANRQRIKSILASDKSSAGYSADELAAMEGVVRGTKLGNTARITGNLLGGGGGLGAAVVAGGAGAMTGGWGAALPLVGAGLKKASDASVNRGTELLDAMVRRRSPLAQNMPAQIESRMTPARAALYRAALLGTQDCSTHNRPPTQPPSGGFFFEDH